MSSRNDDQTRSEYKVLDEKYRRAAQERQSEIDLNRSAEAMGF